MAGKARDYIPALKYGNKIMPEDLAGLIGLPYVGKIIYVDPNSGSDTANSGNSFNDAYATVATAYAAATSGQHDVILIAPSGGTGRTTETTAITWGKRFTHLIGSSAPTQQDARSGMNFSGTTGTASGSITISENGCIFKNLTFTTSTDNNSFVTITGDYNAFIGCDFKGSTNTTTGDDTAARSLVLNGAGENVFVGCTIGADTYNRSAANVSLEVTGGSANNLFEDCLFPVMADAATPVFIKCATTNAISRFLWLKNCLFHNAVNSGSTTLTVGMDLAADIGGNILLDGCSVIGVTDWADDYTLLYGMNMPDITAANAGFIEQIAT